MPFVRSKHVIITYLDPIVLSDLDPEDQKHIGTYVQNKIAKQLEIDAKRI
jgi:1-acyl-sn-glycerol-3-phosphate acyltransferase